MVLSALHDSLHHGITISNWNIQSLLSHQPHCSFPSDSVAPDWTSQCIGSNTGYSWEFMRRNAEERSRNTASTGAQLVYFLFDDDVSECMCLHSIYLNVCFPREPKQISRESGSLIDWCWFHLGGEQRLTVDLSHCERQPLILVLFKQHVLIYVIFTKSAREECLPFYVWLFIEVRTVGGGVFVQPQRAANMPLIRRSGRGPQKLDPTPEIKGYQPPPSTCPRKSECVSSIFKASSVRQEGKAVTCNHTGLEPWKTRN